MSRPVRIFWRIFTISFAVFVLLLLMINLGVFGRMPSLAQLENPSIMLATEVYGDDGTMMGKYYKAKGNRSYVSYKDISPNVVNALVATEDERFYGHSGIDGRGSIRAIVKLGRDGGASTISQQLAKNMLGQGSENFILRVIEKLKECIIAVKLERNFTKQEIIALYLNVVPFADNTFGIRNASRTFYQKEPDRLSVDEAAVLIGMLKANSRYNPVRNYKESFNRRNVVMKQMVKNNYLTEADYQRLIVQPIKPNYKKLDENNGIAPYFLDVLREDIRKWCKENTKADGENYDIYEDGLKVFTTINPRMQLYAEEAVAKHMPVLQRVLSNQASLKNDKVWKGHENVLDAAMKNSDRWKNMVEEGVSEADIKKSFKTKSKDEGICVESST